MGKGITPYEANGNYVYPLGNRHIKVVHVYAGKPSKQKGSEAAVYIPVGKGPKDSPLPDKWDVTVHDGEVYVLPPAMNMAPWRNVVVTVVLPNPPSVPLARS